MVVLVALASAGAYAVAMVLQQRSARTVPDDAALRPSLMVQLMRRRVWLVGMAFNVVAFGLRGFALGQGSLAVVQPVVLMGLFFALLLETRIDHRPFTLREGAGSLALVAGLTLFVLAAGPTDGVNAPATMDWLMLAAVVGSAALLAVAAATRHVGEVRAAWLAAGGALLLALTAALTKLVADDIAQHELGVLRLWSPYALLAVGGVGMVVTQSAFQAGSLRASLPVLSVVEPLASILIGAWVFEEHIATSLTARLGEVSGLALLAAGVVVLTTRDQLEPGLADIRPVSVPTDRRTHLR
jgi:drug/metabolite transporter (DMT)-like permease